MASMSSATGRALLTSSKAPRAKLAASAVPASAGSRLPTPFTLSTPTATSHVSSISSMGGGFTSGTGRGAAVQRCRAVSVDQEVRTGVTTGVTTAVAVPKRKVAGTTAVITGGSQGVGRALARLYAQQGVNVVLISRNRANLQAAEKELRKVAGRPEAVLAVQGDVGDAEAVRRLVQQVEERFESVDLVINNAGICATGTLDDMPEEDIARVISTNLTGPTLVSRAFIPLLRATAARRKQAGPWAAQKGPTPSLVFVNSFVARLPAKYMSVYGATKAGLAGFADSLRYELRSDGINVVQVQPGVINSNFLERATYYGSNGPQMKANVEQLMASGGAQTPEQVAEAVVAAVKEGKEEEVVGAAFQALLTTYRLTGFNPASLAP